jgi:hypothetical protein
LPRIVFGGKNSNETPLSLILRRSEILICSLVLTTIREKIKKYKHLPSFAFCEEKGRGAGKNQELYSTVTVLA